MKTYCIDCHNEIDKRSKRCHSCNKKGERCNFYKEGKPKCTVCGKKIKYNQIFCQSCAAKIRYKNPSNNPNFKKGCTLNISYCIDCNKQLFDYRSIRCDKCFRKYNRGKNHPSFGVISHSKGSYYKKIWMRSSYEIAFVKWLDRKNIKWQYESKTFDLENTTYTPDFYLPEFNLYIEVKGYWRDDAKLKFEEFKQRYCGIRIKIVNKEELKENNIIKEDF